MPRANDGSTAHLQPKTATFLQRPDAAHRMKGLADRNDADQPLLVLHAFQTHEAIGSVAGSGLSPGSYHLSLGPFLWAGGTVLRSGRLTLRLADLALLAHSAGHTA
jgi:hypothetical protein